MVEVNAAHSTTLMTPAALFAHLPAPHVFNVNYSGIGDVTLASLPPSLVSLDVSECTKLTSAAVLPHLPALNDVDVSNTAVGGALVAGLPPGLVRLGMQTCPGLTRDTSLDHLPALRELQCAGTDLSPDMLVTFRARGCVVPAAGVLRGVALAPDGRLACGDSIGAVLVWDVVLLREGKGGRLAIGICLGAAGSFDVWTVGLISFICEGKGTGYCLR